MGDGASDLRVPGPPSPEYVSTGVPGLDHILMGGFLREGFYLLQGDPGSGKTTVALQYILECRRNGEPGLYITLTESPRSLEKSCRSHGWSLDGVPVLDLTRADVNRVGEADSIFHPAETDLAETTRKIIDEVERVKPRHVVFDSLSEMRLLAGDPLRYRREMLSLKGYFEEHRITVLLLDDRTSTYGEIHPETLVDANIIMEQSLPGYGGARRRLHVTKVRGAGFRDGYHDYEIDRGGVLVHPRLVASEYHEQFERKEFLSGIPNLDRLLDGGLTTGTSTLMLGPSGVGKSTIAMQYIAKALEDGHRAAVYLFDEILGTLFQRTEKLCRAGIHQYADSGMLHARQIDPAEMSAGGFAHEVRRVVTAGARIILIDSLNGYLNAMPEERFLTTHLHELFSYLGQQGVTTMMVVTQHGMMQGKTEIDVSYLADTVLLLHYFEARGEIRQAVSVFKKRTGQHERTLRQLTISKDGVVVGEPLREFQGIMTGVPNYGGKTGPLDVGDKGDEHP